MSLLDDASLIVTPNAEKEGKLYSIIPTNGNGDFTVTRATTATRVNAAGLVELVPYNLLTYSEIFSNVAWIKENSSITANTTTAPNGTLTADKLVENTSNSNHRTFQSYAAPSLGSYTYTCYAKQAGRTMFRIAIFDGGTTKTAFFNIANGTIFSTINCTSSITNVGDGWYRCTITATITSTSLQLQSWLSLPDATTVYTGDGTSGVFIWGAQLVEGTSALDYQKTETRLNIPRLDYSLGSCPNILLEPQRTNLALRSEEFNDATWVKNAASVTANATTSPSGIANADTLTGDGSSAVHSIQQNASFTLNAAYSISFYVKKSTNNFAQIYTFNGTGGQFANFDINSGVVGTLGTTFGTAPTSSITSVGNGWYRCTMIFTAALTASSGFGIALVSSSTSARLEANTLSTSVFLWGAQLEAGAYATSYIPTTSASVTRNQDVISKTGISSLIGQTEGTMFVDFIYDHSGTAAAEAISISDGTSANRIFLGNVFSSTFSATVTTSSFAQFTSATSYSLVVGQRYKVAIAYKANDFAFYVNGVQISSGTSGSVPATSRLAFDSGSGSSNFYKPTNAIALWKTRLTNAQLAALTA
jgi:hypothetical protein